MPLSTDPRFLVRFWGVRGSYPTPGAQTVHFGGNTSCVEVQAGSHCLIFDAGSGLIRLGERLQQQVEKTETLSISLFITHAHSDHLLGFPFFAPLFDAHTHLDVFGPSLAGRSLEQVVSAVMTPPYFPVDIHALPSQRSFHTLPNFSEIRWPSPTASPQVSSFQLSSRQEKSQELRVSSLITDTHPQNGAMVYRIDYAGRSLVYATDVEWRDGCDKEFTRFIRNADLLIHDAQYTQSDYQSTKFGFGHSTVEMATKAAKLAKAHQLVLFHHEPTYSDDQVARMEAQAKTLFSSSRSAFEGMEIDLLSEVL